MSYNYGVSPTAVITGTDLRDVRYALNASYAGEVVTILENAGYTVGDFLERGEDGFTHVGIEVVHFGKVPERENIDGVVRAFNRFLELVNNHVRHGEYVLTDELGGRAVVTVGE